MEGLIFGILQYAILGILPKVIIIRKKLILSKICLHPATTDIGVILDKKLTVPE